MKYDGMSRQPFIKAEWNQYIYSLLKTQITLEYISTQQILQIYRQLKKKKVENTAVSIMHLSQSHNSTHCTEIYKKLKACGKLWIYHSGFMINTSHIDPWTKSNTWGFIWVVFIAKQLQLINSSFMYSLTEKIDRT